MPKKTATKAKPKAAAPASKKPAAKAVKPAAKPAVKPAVKVAVKVAAKVAAKPPEAKAAAAKAGPVKATKPLAAKPVPKPAAKPEVKPAGKPVKVEAKVDLKGKAAPAKPTVAVKVPEPVVTPTGASSAIDPKTGRKGITVVSHKPIKKPIIKTPAHSLIPSSVGRLLDPKNPIRRPLIPSGPKAANVRPLGSQAGKESGPELPKAKTPFNKKELEHYRTKLTRKRAELVGDVATMESEALRGQSGALSNLPQHMAEQGSEAYDQSLSLDLAAADRKLIKEIDEALNRIAEGTFGICTMTGKPIGIERLEELPWAALSIEAARSLERPMGRI